MLIDRVFTTIERLMQSEWKVEIGGKTVGTVKKKFAEDDYRFYPVDGGEPGEPCCTLHECISQIPTPRKQP